MSYSAHPMTTNKHLTQAQEKVDFLIIGAGVAGLIAANRLAQAGASVLVTEANHQVGGLLVNIKRRGFRFDAGCQSFESMGMLFPILERLGLAGQDDFWRVFHRMVGPPTADKNYPGGLFDFPLSDWDTVLEAWLTNEQATPEAIHKLHRRLARVDQITRLAQEHPLPAVLPKGQKLKAWLYILKSLWALPIAVGAAGKDFEKIVSDTLGEGDLSRMLARSGYTRTDLLSAAGFFHSWFRDYWYPKGGSGALPHTLARNLTSMGGRIELKQRVESLIINKGRAVGVKTHRGRSFYANKILFTGAAPVLYGKLLKEHPGVGGRFAKGCLQTRPSDPIITVYLGLDMPLDQLRERMRDTMHLFYYPDTQVLRVNEHLDDPDIHSKLWVQINAPNLHEPDMAPPGKSCLAVQAFSDPRWLKRWGLLGKSKGDLSRDQDYKALKHKVAGEITNTAAAIVPELADRVEYMDLGSPMSITRFTHNSEGSTTGWSFNPKHGPMGRPFFRSKSGLPGLYTAGHWYMHPGGVPFAALHGWVTAGRML